MAELLQLDQAAALVGKSEVTLRRLIKAGKIPFQKEKTLTGFIYVVDPDAVRSYYKVRDADIFQAEEMATATAVPPTLSEEEAPKASGVAKRVAVSDEKAGSGPVEYWQKRAEIYEERYTQEIIRHAQTREDLGIWRGRAEQAQSMLLKLLPSGSNEVEVRQAAVPAPQTAASVQQTGTSIALMVALSIIMALVIIGLALYFHFV